MTAVIAKGNLIEDHVDGTPTHTENDPGASFTALTSIERLYDRSPETSYDFEPTADIFSPYQHTITIDLDSEMPTFDTFAILNYSDLRFVLVSVTFKNSVGTEIPRSNETQIDYERTINGVNKDSKVYLFDQVVGVREIEIVVWNTEPETDEFFSIGTVFAGNRIEFGIQAGSLSYSFATQGSKQFTNGGQVVASRNNARLIADFKTTKTPETTVVSDFFQLNYDASVSEPLIFIPQTSESILIYGTQKKPNRTVILPARDTDSGEWLYQTIFQIEEEF
jgi:hypothetical protein